MANTYTQIHIQAVFVVKHRACLIQSAWKDQLYRYIAGIIEGNNHKCLIINGMPDHIHILFGMRPPHSLSDLMQDIKGDSSKWINKNFKLEERFTWQPGYGAFSYKKSDLPSIINYIENQEMHHRKIDFQKEYIKLLEQFEVDYNEDYLFKSVDLSH